MCVGWGREAGIPPRTQGALELPLCLHPGLSSAEHQKKPKTWSWPQDPKTGWENGDVYKIHIYIRIRYTYTYKIYKPDAEELNDAVYLVRAVRL